jgi:hypothetical protein
MKNKTEEIVSDERKEKHDVIQSSQASPMAQSYAEDTGSLFWL